MKITTFNPQIITNNADSIKELFTELGFEVRHDKEEIGDYKVEGIRMKDADGRALDISVPQVELPRDMTAIRMNVDNFDEAYQLLLSHGFKNVYGDKTVDTKSSKSAVLISETGFGINLVEHIKNH